jgi:hypothetical protein
VFLISYSERDVRALRPFDPADFVGTNKRRQIYNITEGLEEKKGETEAHRK